VISPASAVILPATSVQYTALDHYSDQSVKDETGAVTWSSSDASVASVSPSGLVTGKATGVTLISVTQGSDYSPENCRWATWSEQANNKRPRRDAWLIDGMPIKEAASQIGLDVPVVRQLLYRSKKRGENNYEETLASFITLLNAKSPNISR
jgi:hypothetical protein